MISAFEKLAGSIFHRHVPEARLVPKKDYYTALHEEESKKLFINFLGHVVKSIEATAPPFGSQDFYFTDPEVIKAWENVLQKGVSVRIVFGKVLKEKPPQSQVDQEIILWSGLQKKYPDKLILQRDTVFLDSEPLIAFVVRGNHVVVDDQHIAILPFKKNPNQLRWTEIQYNAENAGFYKTAINFRRPDDLDLQPVK